VPGDRFNGGASTFSQVSTSFNKPTLSDGAEGTSPSTRAGGLLRSVSHRHRHFFNLLIPSRISLLARNRHGLIAPAFFCGSLSPRRKPPIWWNALLSCQMRGIYRSRDQKKVHKNGSTKSKPTIQSRIGTLSRSAIRSTIPPPNGTSLRGPEMKQSSGTG
jgi:hypothetical protein